MCEVKVHSFCQLAQLHCTCPKHDNYQLLLFFPRPVERCWRRDRIIELIKVLAQIVPACQKKDATTGSIVLVTRKTKCDYSIIHNVSTYILYTSTCVVCGVPFIIVEPFCI